MEKKFPFKIAIEKHSCNQVTAFHLDEPINLSEIKVRGSELFKVRLRGWIISQKPLVLYFREKDKYQYMELNKKRIDVVEVFKKKIYTLDEDQNLGFNFEHNLETSFLAIGVLIDGIKHELWHLRLTPKQKIIKGLEDWLFLDNDTNRSVDQYTGDYLLNSIDLIKWQEYLYRLAELTSHFKCQTCLLIVPSKEKLLTKFYPYKKAETTIIDQLFKKLYHPIPIAYPIERLLNAKLPSYRKCDTHWTSFGSMLGFIEVLEKLDIDISKIQKDFENDSYIKRTLSGDLGEKTYPISYQDEFVYRGPNYNSCIKYDSALPNIGRTIITENPAAFLNKTCLLFGSSSSYTMLNFASRVFRQIYFVHFAANIDPNLVEKINPDYIICQTNERFCVKPPSTDYKIEDKIKEKWFQLNEADKNKVLSNQKKSDFYNNAVLCTWLDMQITE